MLILNPRNSQVMFITIRMLRVRGEELLGCCERQAAVNVAGEEQC